jgi:hypothetical protein
LWLRRRVESVVYLALPRRACVARWLCRIVGTGCFVESEHDDCPADYRAGLPSPGTLSRIREKIVNVARMCSVLFVLNSGFRRFCTHDEPILYYRLSPLRIIISSLVDGVSYTSTSIIFFSFPVRA